MALFFTKCMSQLKLKYDGLDLNPRPLCIGSDGFKGCTKAMNIKK